MPAISPPQAVTAVGQQLSFSCPPDKISQPPSNLVIYNKSPYELNLLGYLIPAWSIIPFDVAALLGGATQVIITSLLASGVTATSVATVYAVWFAQNEQIPNQQAFIADSIIAALSGVVETVIVSNTQSTLQSFAMGNGSSGAISTGNSYNFPIIACSQFTQLEVGVASTSTGGFEDFQVRFYSDAAGVFQIQSMQINRSLGAPGHYTIPVLGPYYRLVYFNGTGSTQTATVTVLGYSNPFQISGVPWVGTPIPGVPINQQAQPIGAGATVQINPSSQVAGKARIFLGVNQVWYGGLSVVAQAGNASFWDARHAPNPGAGGTVPASQFVFDEIELPISDWFLTVTNFSASSGTYTALVLLEDRA